MGKTSYTGITTRHRGEKFRGFNIFVKWGGRVKATSIGCSSIECIGRALKIRDRFWKELGRPSTERLIRTRQAKPFVRNGDVVVSVGAQSRSFSIRKHGRREAMRMAKEARHKWLTGE